MSTERTFNFLLAAAIVALGIYAWLARYAHPMGDDWSYACMGMDHPLLPWLKEQYFTWNGRYFSNILVGKGPLVLGLDHLWLYRLVPGALILLTLLSYTALLSAFLHEVLVPWQRWVGGLLLTALFLHGMPDLPEGIYWYTGAITYQVGSVFLLLQMASFAAFLQRRYFISRTAHLVFNLLLALIVVGSSEVHMLLLIAFHAAVLLQHWRSGERPSVGEWTAIGAVVLGAIVMFAAPGNEVRASYFVHKHDLLRSLGWSVLQTCRFSLTWALDPALLGVSLLYIPISRDLSRRVTWFQRSFGFTPFWSTLALGGVIFLCAFPAYWGTGILGQHRTINVAYAFFLPLWFINLTVWANRFPSVMSSSYPRWTKALVPVLVAIALFTSHNGFDAMDDLVSGTARDFDRQMKERYELIQRSDRVQGTILLPAITAQPKALYLFDIKSDPTFWPNRAYGIYFDRRDQKIKLADQPSP